MAESACDFYKISGPVLIDSVLAPIVSLQLRIGHCLIQRNQR